MQLNAQNRYAHIDGMRAFAVMLVVLAHAGLGSILPGGSGVTIFFVISGFIITTLLLRERARTGLFNVRRFYYRRLMKLAPPFVIFVALPSIVAMFFGANLLIGFLSETFFVYNWLRLWISPEIFPGTDVTWSLSIEEQFYIVFAIFWMMAVKTRHWERATIILSTCAIIFSLGLRFSLASSSLDFSERIYYGTDTRLEAIALGVLLAVAIQRFLNREPSRLNVAVGSSWFFATAVLLFLLSLLIRDSFFRDTLRFTLQACAAAMIIAWGFGGLSRTHRFLDRLIGWRVVQFIGLASYSIYLAHLLVIEALSPVLAGMPEGIRILTLVVSGTAVGCLAYQVVERPVHKWVTRRSQQRGSRRLEAA